MNKLTTGAMRSSSVGLVGTAEDVTDAAGVETARDIGWNDYNNFRLTICEKESNILTDADGRVAVIMGARAAAEGGGGGVTTASAGGSSSHAPAGALPNVGTLKDGDAPKDAAWVGRGAEGIAGFRPLAPALEVATGAFLKAPMSTLPIGV